MFKLVCTSGMNKNQEYELTEGCEITIGRSDKNHICVFDKKSSRHHCKVYLKNGVVVVEDLNSTNGIVINNVFVRGSHEVRLNDQLGIGQTIFTLMRSDGAQPAPGQAGDDSQSQKYQNLMKTNFQITKTTFLRKLKTEKEGKGTGFLSFFEIKNPSSDANGGNNSQE